MTGARGREDIDEVLAFRLWVVAVGFASPSCHWRCMITDFVAHWSICKHIFSPMNYHGSLTVIWVPLAANHCNILFGAAPTL